MASCPQCGEMTVSEICDDVDDVLLLKYCLTCGWYTGMDDSFSSEQDQNELPCPACSQDGVHLTETCKEDHAYVLVHSLQYDDGGIQNVEDYKKPPESDYGPGQHSQCEGGGDNEDDSLECPVCTNTDVDQMAYVEDESGAALVCCVCADGVIPIDKQHRPDDKPAKKPRRGKRQRQLQPAKAKKSPVSRFLSTILTKVLPWIQRALLKLIPKDSPLHAMASGVIQAGADVMSGYVEMSNGKITQGQFIRLTLQKAGEALAAVGNGLVALIPVEGSKLRLSRAIFTQEGATAMAAHAMVN